MAAFRLTRRLWGSWIAGAFALAALATGALSSEANAQTLSAGSLLGYPANGHTFHAGFQGYIELETEAEHSVTLSYSNQSPVSYTLSASCGVSLIGACGSFYGTRQLTGPVAAPSRTCTSAVPGRLVTASSTLRWEHGRPTHNAQRRSELRRLTVPTPIRFMSCSD